jgi:hypothetical protein
MAETTPISLADLLVDTENPRLPQPNLGQRDAMRALARHLPKKLITLARDIVKHGPSPSELPIVMPFNDDLNRYVVLEGNRRFVTLKALENPDSFLGVLESSLLTELRALSKEYQEAPVESLMCYVVNDRDEAQHWIELRHTGQNDGAGIVPWGSDDAARFRARTGSFAIHTQALNFLESNGHLTPEQRRNVPSTSFLRLLGTPYVRDKLGLKVHEGRLWLLGDEKRVAKALLYVIDDLVSGRVGTRQIYTKKQRVKYANSIPANIVVTPGVAGAEAKGAQGAKAKAKQAAAVKAKRLKTRDMLIPRDCPLSITDLRLREIEAELRKLSLTRYPNAVGVMFRVFIELCIDTYMTRQGLPTKDNKGFDLSLMKKLVATATDLENKQKLTKQQTKPVHRAAAKDSFLAPSATVMNQYVHNPYFFPAPGDLRAHWNSLQPFMIAICSP